MTHEWMESKELYFRMTEEINVIHKTKDLIWVDDSGDPGFKFKHGSSAYLVIACIVADNENAKEIHDQIVRLKHILRWSESSEFKFAKTNPVAKLAFFSQLSNLEFRAFVVLADKTKTPERKPGDFYNEMILAALKSISPQIESANIVIDGESGKNYRQKAKTYFRQNLPKGTIDRVRYQDSKKNVLLQLADMIAGAVNYETQNPKTGGVYTKHIANKIKITCI
jgi:hypothetical protein